MVAASKRELIGDLLKFHYEEELIMQKAIINKLMLLDNPNRVQILNILDKIGPQTITQINKKLKLTYNNCFRNIKKLEKHGLIKTEKDYNTQGKPVKVILADWVQDIDKEGIDAFYKQIKKEQKTRL